MIAAPSSTRAYGAGVIRPEVSAFFEERTGSVQYVVRDPGSRCCAVVDPVLDYDEKSGTVATRSADALLAFCRAQGLTVEWILDTHPHADHFSAAGYLKDVTGAKTAIGEHVVDVQRLWTAIYHLDGFSTDGCQWDRLFADGDVFRIGGMEASVLHSPGHTLASVTYVPCRTKPACSSATTTGQAAARRPGKAPSGPRKRATFTLQGRPTRMRLSRCGRRVTPGCRCPS
jgi:glyoxylase-like metal-dependent hydrolase (beta-lactamase superfamily II)